MEGAGAVSKPKLFRLFGPQSGLGIREGRGPPGPFPGSATELSLESVPVITEQTTLPSVVEIPCQHSLSFACSNLSFSRKTAGIEYDLC